MSFGLFERATTGAPCRGEETRRGSGERSGTTARGQYHTVRAAHTASPSSVVGFSSFYFTRVLVYHAVEALGLVLAQILEAIVETLINEALDFHIRTSKINNKKRSLR